MRIAVIGLGRIGSRILRELRARFPETIGVDRDQEKVQNLRAEGFPATVDPKEAAGAEVYLVAVSTGPEMEGLFAAAAAIEPAPGGLVSVESTVVPGTMARLAELFAARGLSAGRDYYLVHSPHRILFGEEESVFGQPRVIGGITPACLERGVAFYRGLVPAVHPCAEIRLVEVCKLVENTLRYLEIAVAEALALYCHEAGLDFEELRRLVASKGNVRLLRAEYGIGGECLPKDARLLHEATGCRLIADAMAIDEEYRSWLFREAFAPRVLVRGLTFKPGWRDLGYSRAVELVERLRAAGCRVFVEDPLYGPEELEAMGFAAWRGEPVEKVISWGRVEREVGALGQDPRHQ
ncbi:MAG: NAD-binding protein [Firmicutes bacterium]|nr:NAD-binding protein [Bacillota bacterium]